MVNSNLELVGDKYVRLMNYVSSLDSFKWIYRAEGDKTLQSGNRANPQLQGTWYTDSWDDIQQIHKPKLKSFMGGREPSVYALLVPEVLLNSRDILSKSNREINLVNPSLRSGRISLDDSVNLDKNNFPPANKETYVGQFDFVREYNLIKNK